MFPRAAARRHESSLSVYNGAMWIRDALVSLVFVTACTIGTAAEDEGEQRPPGAMCADNKECAGNYCTSEGYCAQTTCKGGCPAGWTCERSGTVLTFGGSDYCEPSCAACPAGTRCEGNAVRCERPEPKVTLAGDPPKLNQLSNIDLVIDAGNRGPYTVAWAFAEGAPPTPAKGTGTKVAVTFAVSASYLLHVTLEGGGLADKTVSVPVQVCGGDGAECAYSTECCGGECALERTLDDSGKRQAYCVAKCPATCKTGYACRDFTGYAGSGRPNGTFCLPEPAVITIDVSPAAPKVNQPITFTATATSPAGLRILSQEWYLDDFDLSNAEGPTYVLTESAPKSRRVTFRVYDDGQQITKKSVDVNITQ